MATAAIWAALAGLGPPAPALETPDEAEERIERALELKRRLEALGAELDELLDALPPELLREVERRWLEEQSGAPDKAPAEAAPAPAPEPEPKPEMAPDPPKSAPPPSAAEPPPAPAAVPEPAAAPDSGDPRCGTLAVLDSNGDGAISGADRHWRYLRLWKDDGDGVVEERELRSLYDHDIRRVSAPLYSYTTKKDADRGVWVEDFIYFDLPGRRDRAVLTIDAGRLARGGELRLEDATGAPLDGFVALGKGLDWVLADGRRLAVLCR